MAMYSCIDLYAVEEQMRLDTCRLALLDWHREIATCEFQLHLAEILWLK